MLNILKISILFILFQISQICFAEVPPLPREPKVKPHPLWHHWHQLNEHRNYYEYLNPNNKEVYFYRGLETFAPDLQLDREAFEEIYKLIYSQYIELLESGAEMEESPSLNLENVEISRAIHSSSFFLNLHYYKILTILHKQLWDQRYISNYLFFSRVDKKHRPLESVKSMASSSQRASKIIDRFMQIYEGEIKAIRLKMSALVKKAMADRNDYYSGQYRAFAIESNLLSHRLSNLEEHLYRAVQYANDVVRDKKEIIDLPTLEVEMANLGKGLKSIIDYIQVYKSIRESNHSNYDNSFNFGGTLLSNPEVVLNDLFGVGRHVLGKTLYSNERGRQNVNVYSIYQETIIIQYLLAAGSLMAKISEISEGRGSKVEILAQELRFRKAQVKAYLDKGKKNTVSTSLALTSQSSPTDLIQRRDFVTGKLVQERKSIEDRLWEIFFENSKLDEIMASSNSSNCEMHLLMNLTK